MLPMTFLGLRKLGNICCGHIFCVPDTKFVSATNVARVGKRGNICVGNNVSSFARALRMEVLESMWDVDCVLTGATGATRHIDFLPSYTASFTLFGSGDSYTYKSILLLPRCDEPYLGQLLIYLHYCFLTSESPSAKVTDPQNSPHPYRGPWHRGRGKKLHAPNGRIWQG